MNILKISSLSQLPSVAYTHPNTCPEQPHQKTPEDTAGKLTRKAVATYTLSWFISSQNNGKYSLHHPPPPIFSISCQVPRPHLHIAVAQTFGQYYFPTVLFLIGQAVSHSCCLNTPHCVRCAGEVVIPPVLSDQSRHATMPTQSIATRTPSAPSLSTSHLFSC